MGRLRYIGSKARIVGPILDAIGPAAGTFFDVFSGTGVVSRAASDRGWAVKANDHLISSARITFAQLASKVDAPFNSIGGYDNAIATLNGLPPTAGFIFAEYSPSGQSRSGQQRMYFTCQNAGRIDAVRKQIELWKTAGAIGEPEYSILIADLLEAANCIANIAGTYGCFLRKWSPPAKKQLCLAPRKLREGKKVFSVTCRDAFSLRAHARDVVYLDPPYTKRQYAAYYHILETIASGDSPEVEGITGLRPWRSKSSPFCFRKTALSALAELCARIGAARAVISYSSEGHIALRDMTAKLGETGDTSVIALGEIGRYRPNTASRHTGVVSEYLITYRRRETRLAVLPAASRREVVQ